MAGIKDKAKYTTLGKGASILRFRESLKDNFSLLIKISVLTRNIHILVFVFLTSIIVIDKKKNKIREDGVLVSCDADEKVNLAPVQGSFYTEMMQKINERIKKKGDWRWLVDGLKNQTDDILMASEVESLTKRCASYVKWIH